MVSTASSTYDSAPNNRSNGLEAEVIATIGRRTAQWYGDYGKQIYVNGKEIVVGSGSDFGTFIDRISVLCYSTADAMGKLARPSSWS